MNTLFKRFVGLFSTTSGSFETMAHCQETHTKARTSPYPLSNVARAPVSDDKVPWTKHFPEYNPVRYTAPTVVSQPIWADPDFSKEQSAHEMKSPKYNAMDGLVNRQSFVGKYEVKDNVPVNPVGRTGISGRGLLGKWGPNHAADPVVTRWKRDSSDNVVKHKQSKKPVLQFIAVQRKDTGEWAVPGGMVDAGEAVSVTLKREFGEEALNTLEASPEERKRLAEHISQLFQKGREIYSGYVDDPRNTDNAWMETVAMNFHDAEGTSVGQLPLHPGDDAGAVRWLDIDDTLHLYASHLDFIKKVVELHDAHWSAATTTTLQDGDRER